MSKHLVDIILGTRSDMSHLLASGPNPDTFPIIWDSGASCCVTFDRNDFVGPIRDPPPSATTEGITNDVKVVGTGFVAWTMKDSKDMFRTIKLPAVLIPEARVRLLSLSSLAQQYMDEDIFGNGRVGGIGLS
eukprot:scaffold5475_cov142-Cylindrotheca_fusiformis.AAC.1